MSRCLCVVLEVFDLVPELEPVARVAGHCFSQLLRGLVIRVLVPFEFVCEASALVQLLVCEEDRGAVVEEFLGNGLADCACGSRDDGHLVSKQQPACIHVTW